MTKSNRWKTCHRLLVTGVLVVFSFAEGHIISNLIAAEVDQNLVDHEWLSREMDRDDMAVIDVRSPDRYAAGHIPGAVNVPVDDTFESGTNSGLAAPTSRIQQLFSNAGVDQITRVILYDHGTMLNAARVLWILEMHGHKRVSLLNRGYQGWIEPGNDVSAYDGSWHEWGNDTQLPIVSEVDRAVVESSQQNH